MTPRLFPQTLIGVDRLALIASPPSPEKPAKSVPAKVVTTSMPVSIVRIRLFIESAIKRIPVVDKNNPAGELKLA